MTAGLVFRPPRSTDLAFIAQTYARGARKALWAQELDGVDWSAVADRFVSACVLADHCVVAGWEASDVVLGYALGHREGADRAVLHWVHVKALYQHRGIATRLVGALAGPARDLVVTHTATEWQRRLVSEKRFRVADRLPWLWLLTREVQHGSEAA